jgi:DNA-binding transcriptional regulator YiaG
MTATEVKEARKKLNLTQAKFAKKLKVTPRTIINWEHEGITKIEHAERLRRLIAAK